MKKLYSLALGLFMAFGAYAQSAVTIGETGYETLEAALAAAQEGDVITVNQDIEISARIFPNKKNLTIQGANPEIAIKRKWDLNAIMILAKNQDAGLVVKNITVDGSSFGSTNSVIECAENSASLTLQNVTVKQANQTGGNIIVQKSGGKLTLENVSITDSQKAEGVYDLFVGNSNKTTLKGTGDFDIHIEKTNNMTADGYTGTSTLYLDSYAANRTIIVGGSLANFSLGNAPEGYSLVEQNGNLVLNYAKMVIKNDTTGALYSDLQTAMSEAASGDVLTILENVDLTFRANAITKNLTIQGANPDVVIKRTNADSNHFMFEPQGRSLTFKNIVIDANNISNKQPVFNVKYNNGSLTLENVKVINAGKSASIANVQGTINLNNASVEESGDINTINLAANTATLNGNVDNFQINYNTGATIKVADGGQLTNTTPIVLNPSDPKAADVAVTGCTDPSKFKMADAANWHLETSDGNLVLAEGTTTGIESISADENAPVEYYNLQGMRVENPANGIFILRQGSKVTKIAL